jgi:hypothetical protein
MKLSKALAAGIGALTLATSVAAATVAKRPFRDGPTHVVLEPLDFVFRMNGMPRAQGCARAAMARLASLVPGPRLNLTRFRGVFRLWPN